MPQSTLTVKGQATIPKFIRNFLKLKPQDQVSFRIEKGRVLLEAVHSNPSALFGKYGKKQNKILSPDEMNNSVQAEAVALNK